MKPESEKAYEGVDKAPQGDAELLSQLFRKYSGELKRVVVNVVERKDIAEEIVQEAFLSLWKRYRGRGLRKPWSLLFTIAGNKATDYRRRAKHEQGNPLPQSEAIPEEDQPDHLAELYDMKKHLHLVIGELNASLHPVAVMRCFEHLSTPEIAERLHISVRAAEQRLTRVTTLFRTRLAALTAETPNDMQTREAQNVPQ